MRFVTMPDTNLRPAVFDTVAKSYVRSYRSDVEANEAAARMNDAEGE
jgi:hypothetical protein